MLQHLAGYIARQKKLALGVLIFTTIGQIAELIIPLITGWTIDQIIITFEAGTFTSDIVLLGAIIIVIFASVRGLMIFFGRFLGYVQGERIIYEIRGDLYEKYENSSLSFFDEHHTGDLMARATTDLEPMGEFLVWGQRILLQATITFVGVYTVLFLIDVRLFTIIAIVSPTLFVLSYLISRKLGPLYFEIRNQYGLLTKSIQESISGVQVTKAFSAKEREKTKFDRENIKYRDLRAYAFKIRSIFLPMILFIVNLMITILIFLGGLLVINLEISLGTLIILLTYFTMLTMPTRFLAFSLIIYQRTRAAGERVFRLIELPTEITIDKDDIPYPDDSTPTIIFEDISFKYKERKTLANISLTIKPGDRIAILGPTGSGKTTLVSLIPRFYDPTTGKIKIITYSTAYNLQDIELKSWRRKFGIVSQEIFLFGRSIKENISFGLPETTLEEIKAVSKIAQVDKFVDNFPDGYDTIVGERGVTLSGGQKQRIAIARMLLRNPDIMILDDATSAVDITTESEFQNSFTNYLADSGKDQIVIFISHRLSTAKMANKILIMNRGQIVEQGTHEELMKNGEIYPILWKTQEGGMADIQLALERITKSLDVTW